MYKYCIWIIIFLATTVSVWYGYFEQKYNCLISWSQISVSLENWTWYIPCLTYLSGQYKQYHTIQLQILQLSGYNTLTWYRYWVNQQLQNSLKLSAKNSQTMLLALKSYENTLFQKTILYLRRDFWSRIARYRDYQPYRRQAMSNTLKAWAISDYNKIQELRNKEVILIALMTQMIQAKDFEELVPLYNVYLTYPQ
jgi:hypothetical protein